MIDVNKKYQTRDGRAVVLSDIVLYNSAGALVSYPVKGVIIEKGRRQKSMIWSIDGLADIVWGYRTRDDLIEKGVE